VGGLCYLYCCCFDCSICLYLLPPPPLYLPLFHSIELTLTNLRPTNRLPCAGTNDGFKAKGYSQAVTKLKKLDYRVSSTAQLQGQPGFRKGGSILVDIQQILDTGTTEKLTHYMLEPRNVASIALQQIHGVGPSIAKRLMDVGIYTIEHAREQMQLVSASPRAGNATTLTKYAFDSRQRIGIKHYEAFQERIPREEVGRLAVYVLEQVQKLVPRAQVLPVGSYRRGKQSCGDCDLLIAPPVGQPTISVLWDLLKAMSHTGFLTDHLTGFEDEVDARAPLCTYMGVCKELGRTDAIFRRIDIKVYPRACVPFALLYFTGSDYFNRSMRNYCHSFSVDDGKHNLTLSDQGLYPCTRTRVKEAGKWVRKVTWKGVCLPCKTERDVFDVLNLVYKEPHERDVYAAQMNDEKFALPVKFPEGSYNSQAAQAHGGNGGSSSSSSGSSPSPQAPPAPSQVLRSQAISIELLQSVDEEEGGGGGDDGSDDEDDGRANYLLVQK